MKVFDVAVLGAGPAGSAAARTLALAGVKTCIIDRAVFPRSKLCGGLLTLRCKKHYDRVFNDDWSRVIIQQSAGADFYLENRLVHSLRDCTHLYQSDRFIFDDFLLQQAVQAGAEPITGNAAKRIDETSRLLHLDDGSFIRYRYLIACDGAYSLVARTLYGRALPRNNAAAALEIDLDRSDTGYPADQPQIFLDAARWGYAWIFPKGNQLTLGLGALPQKNVNLNDIFSRFLVSRLGYLPNARFQGHLIPFNAYRERPGRGNILLCGDAAGLVDPITGEGIAHAIHSGFLAGRAVARHFSSPAAALNAYNLAYQRIANSLIIASQLSYLIFPRLTERTFKRVFPLSDSFARLHLSLLADEIGYPRYRKLILGKLARGALRRLPGQSRSPAPS